MVRGKNKARKTQRTYVINVREMLDALLELGEVSLCGANASTWHLVTREWVSARSHFLFGRPFEAVVAAADRALIQLWCCNWRNYFSNVQPSVNQIQWLHELFFIIYSVMQFIVPLSNSKWRSEFRHLFFVRQFKTVVFIFVTVLLVIIFIYGIILSTSIHLHQNYEKKFITENPLLMHIQIYFLAKRLWN